MTSRAPLLIVNAVAMQARGAGDYVYRVEQPSLALGRAEGARVVTVSTVSPHFKSTCLAADVLVLHLLTEHDVLPLVEERKRFGRPTVYEICDNFAAMHEEVGARDWFSDPINLASALQLIGLSDAAQATGQGIAQHFGFLTGRMMVFENQLAHVGQLKERRSGLVVIGWAGSSGHARDIQEVAPTIATVCSAFPTVRFAYMGDDRFYPELFRSIPQHQRSYSPPGSLEDYFRFLDQLDIGVAPLRDNPYNRCRSDIKFVEYASRGVVPVLAAVGPYLANARDGETALLFRDPEHLSTLLTRLIEDPLLRENIARRARSYVTSERTESHHVQRRFDFYRSLCTTQSDTPLDARILSRVRPESEYFDVTPTDAERHLVAGIGHESAGEVAKGRQCYEKACESLEGYYLPHFYLGYSLMRAGDASAVSCFDEALRRNPHSLRSLLYKGRMIAVHDTAEAASVFKAALEISPRYAPVCEEMALLSERAGELQEAANWYNKALQANPFYSRAALGLGRMFSLYGSPSDARSAFDSAAGLAPNWAEAQYQAAMWHFRERNLAEAAKYCVRALELDSERSEARDLMLELIKQLDTLNPTKGP